MTSPHEQDAEALPVPLPEKADPGAPTSQRQMVEEGRESVTPQIIAPVAGIPTIRADEKIPSTIGNRQFEIALPEDTASRRTTTWRTACPSTS